MHSTARRLLLNESKTPSPSILTTLPLCSCPTLPIHWVSLVTARAARSLPRVSNTETLPVKSTNAIVSSAMENVQSAFKQWSGQIRMV